jgi:hypothetical protein
LEEALDERLSNSWLRYFDQTMFLDTIRALLRGGLWNDALRQIPEAYTERDLAGGAPALQRQNRPRFKKGARLTTGLLTIPFASPIQLQESI